MSGRTTTTMGRWGTAMGVFAFESLPEDSAYTLGVSAIAKPLKLAAFTN